MEMEIATRRFNVDEYHKLAEIGVLKPYERVELLDGVIYYMETNGEEKRFTVEEYHRMAEAGILDEDDRIELIDGEISLMSPMGIRHLACVDELSTLLFELLGRTVQLRVQGSIRLNDSTEPQPDIGILKPHPDRYARKPATAKDVYLLIEVAESSFESDRKKKLSLYARSEIPEVWIVNIVERVVEQYSEPTNGAYMKIEKWTIGQQIQSHQLTSLALSLDKFLQF